MRDILVDTRLSILKYFYVSKNKTFPIISYATYTDAVHPNSVNSYIMMLWTMSYKAGWMEGERDERAIDYW